MIGETVGSYTITAQVAVGGMGTVYRGEHALIGKAAAIKILHPEVRSNREIVQRFFNEAKATTQIKHPGIVEIFDFGYLPSGDGYIIMEYLEGVSLAGRLEEIGKIAEGEAALIMRSVCSALAAAHAKSIIHRDLKPDNVFLALDPDAPTGERPKVLDFGIAKLGLGLEGPTSATKTGSVMGTPTYMSPEQCRGAGSVDARTDLYSIGCMFYEMLTGRPPFVNMAAGELIGAHLFIEPDKPSQHAEVSPQAEELVMQLLAKSPDKRPQTAQELGKLFGAIAQVQGLTANSIVTPVLGTPSLRQAAVTSPPAGTPSLRRSAASPLASAATMPSHAGSDVVHKTSQPTTLSGAASQSASHPVVAKPRSRVALFAGITAAAAAGGFAIVMAVTKKDKPSAPAAPAAATQPAPAATPAPTPAPAPAPAPPPPQVAPAPAPTTPTPEVAPEVTPPVPAVTAGKPTKPSRHKPSKPTQPATQVKPTQPATTPAGDKPKPGTGSGSAKILIENDV